MAACRAHASSGRRELVKSTHRPKAACMRVETRTSGVTVHPALAVQLWRCSAADIKHCLVPGRAHSPHGHAMLLHVVPGLKETYVVVVSRANSAVPYLALAMELWFRTAAKAGC